MCVALAAEMRELKSITSTLTTALRSVLQPTCCETEMKSSAQISRFSAAVFWYRTQTAGPFRECFLFGHLPIDVASLPANNALALPP